MVKLRRVLKYFLMFKSQTCDTISIVDLKVGGTINFLRSQKHWRMTFTFQLFYKFGKFRYLNSCTEKKYKK